MFHRNHYEEFIIIVKQAPFTILEEVSYVCVTSNGIILDNTFVMLNLASGPDLSSASRLFSRWWYLKLVHCLIWFFYKFGVEKNGNTRI